MKVIKGDRKKASLESQPGLAWGGEGPVWPWKGPLLAISTARPHDRAITENEGHTKNVDYAGSERKNKWKIADTAAAWLVLK